MDATTIAALAGKAAQLNILYLVAELFVIVGAIGFIVVLGERTLGFDLKGFINNVEKVADGGNVWPGVTLLLGILCLVGLVLFIGLR